MKKLAVHFECAPPACPAIIHAPVADGLNFPGDQTPPVTPAGAIFEWIATFPVAGDDPPAGIWTTSTEDPEAESVLRLALPPAPGEKKLKSRPPLPTRKCT